jgi:hypothetical protein
MRTSLTVRLALVATVTFTAAGRAQGAEGVWDITLAAGGVANPGDPVLLIRVLDLNYNSASTAVTPYILASSTTNTRADSLRPELIIPADSISPNYKVLIFPYIQGDTLPSTTWNSTHTAVTVNMPTYSDTITFSPAASGKTDVSVTRNGSTIINVNTPIAPFQ